jgi:cysteine desulfuration protein SufE
MTQLEKLIQRFQGIDRATRLETLLDYSKKLPPLPERFHAARDRGVNLVPECQTPVFLFTELDGGKVHIHADVPREAPTVRGFVAILARGLEGATPSEVAQLPDDILHELRLAEALGMTRLQGLTAIVQRIKRMVKDSEK